MARPASTDEIVWVAGDTKYLLVILRKGSTDTTHYFYFPGEYTVPKILKWVDIEPLRKHGVEIGGQSLAVYMSRVHYWGLVLWINPTPRTKPASGGIRPICVFEINFHTPYLAYDTDPEVKITEVRGMSGLGWWDRLMWFIASGHFATRVHRISPSDYDGYPTILEETKPEAISDKSQLFDNQSILNATHYVLLVGSSSDVTSLESELADGYGDIFEAKLDDFLGKIGAP